MRKPAIFISYRRIDANWAAVMLRHQIQRNFPDVDVFIDVASIRPGQRFKSTIQDNIKDCAILFAVIGPNWLTASDNYGMRRIDKEDDLVRREIAQALAQDHTCVVPFLVDDAPMPPAEALPKTLRGMRELHAFRMEHFVFERDVEDVCRFIEDHLGLNRTMSYRPNLQEEVVAHPEFPADLEEIGREAARALVDAGTDWRTMLSVSRIREDRSDFHIAFPIREAAQIQIEQSEGEQSTAALKNKHNLAVALLRRGKAELAEPILRDLVQLREKTRGAEHPSTLNSRNAHARSLLNAGRAAEAALNFQDLIQLREDSLGENHPDTLATRHAHAMALLDTGRLAEAQELLCSLSALRESRHGIGHPSALASLCQQARALLEVGKTDDAEQILQRVNMFEAGTEAGKARRAVLYSMLADQRGNAAEANAALNAAEEYLAGYAPEHYLRRELAHYRKTRIPGKPGGTTLWAKP